jgi:predicted TIM-barrel fold metal-dependent hydrolase
MPGFFAHRAQDIASGVCGCCTTSRRGFLRSLTAGAGALALPAIARAQTPSAQALTRIDTHHHYYPPEAKKYGGLGGRLTDHWTPQTAIDEMDKGGVKTAILSMASAPMAWFKLAQPESRSMVRAINDYGAKMMADHPGRFGLFAFLSMYDVDGTLKEIEYAFDTLKADGVGIATGYGDIYPGDAKFAPIFEELNRRKAVVYFHPTTQACCGGAIPGLNDSVIEVPHDTSRAVMSLLMSGNLPKWRDIRFLWSHGGGTIPMLAERIAWLTKTLVKDSAKLMPEGPLPEFRRFYYDTANAGYPSSMAALTKIADTSHIVFGTDFPYVSTEWNAKALQRAGLTPEQIRDIETRNALALIPRLKV